MLELQVQSMDAVLDVVTTIGRVNASIVIIHARNCRIQVVFQASALATRRLPSLLRSLVSVLEVSFVTADEDNLPE